MAQLDSDVQQGRIAQIVGAHPAASVAGAVLLLVVVVLGASFARQEPLIIEAHDETVELGEIQPADGEQDPEELSEPSASALPESITVDVTGAVTTPGVVELAADARVIDAIEASGGLTADADLSSVNRAAKLADGEKVHIPCVGEAPAAPVEGGEAASGTSADAPVNINTAGADELDELPGVGPSTAQAIIDEREQGGPFTSVADIMRVSGIGEKKFEKLKDAICI